ncbi:PAS domain S-box protein [Polynucleobacter sp. Latsch14-2]|jgi:PAS domain S-box-containing protein|uniref:Putative PAS/PAC sensor protein n=1 Tax=Polynucleobacter asymbioticus (strain DSM 18221 / CIP 109841 / QLW-P1DMWA-1) TaxID=312153 RepID=A4SXJ5_POLAQ|nr:MULTISPECIES: PAS domain S-box protein [Polynucleobacter]MBT8582387.1 PAS domain S-box protein [Polynucleobacter paneuropaeus]ABP34209.1 putative PAS/PAC sensor protein [Polynucleobacter asymbioticus QLW-P1DMWA-1]APC06047.1 histidine kinase [Polynucleobacter asymbioticus]MBT8611177.1 PAS domain S-box protein [Polynucleobacter paneuropaeus]MBU3614443.1 PAS domain S-box protein [Polynucleobacter sp. Latsch14-2]
MPNAIDFETLVSQIGEAVIISDRDENILFWNASAERIFGYSSDEALGKTLSIITPERFRERHSKGYFHTIQTGVTKYGNTLLRVPAVHKDGRSISIAFSVSMLFDDQNQPIAIAAVVRDETERFQEERNLKAKLAAYEKASNAPNG